MIEWIPPESLRAFEAAIWLSLFGAPLGSILIFRRLSFFGDALGHSSLGGIAVAFLLFHESILALSLGALISVLLTVFVLFWLEHKAKLPSDLAMTVSYSGLFAFGLLFLGAAEDSEHLEHILLGDIWNLRDDMLWFIRAWAVVVTSFLMVAWRPLWATVMDAGFSRSLGFSTQWMDALLLIVVSISVVGMIQSVGVVLVAAYLILPPAAALPWVRSLRGLCFASVSMAGISSILGISIALLVALPAGPCIALSSFVIMMMSQVVKSKASSAIH